MSLEAFYVAATLVVLIQFVRLRDLRIVPLLLVFACLAVAHHQLDWFAARPWHFAAGVSGLAMLVVLSPRRPAGR
jgi:uncharacterized integral membrane protein